MMQGQQRLTNDDIILKKLDILKTIKEYCFEVMHINEIQPSSYLRISAAIDYLSLELQDLYRYGKEEMIRLNDNKVYVSLESMREIQLSAKPINSEENNICIKKLMDIEISLLNQFFDMVFARPQKEVIESDIDSLLAAFAKADKYINAEQ